MATFAANPKLNPPNAKNQSASPVKKVPSGATSMTKAGPNLGSHAFFGPESNKNPPAVNGNILQLKQLKTNEKPANQRDSF